MTFEECMADGMSATEAAKATGGTESAARRWACKRGLKWRDGRLLPVTHNGVTYPSVTAAARALGTTQPLLSQHLAKRGHLGHLGRPRGPSKGTMPACCKPKPVAGFPSQAAAARALGMSETAMKEGLRGGGERVVARLMASQAQADRARIMKRDGRTQKTKASGAWA